MSSTQSQAFNDHPNDRNLAPDQNQSGTNNNSGTGQSKGKSLLQKIFPGKHGNNANTDNTDNTNNNNTNIPSHDYADRNPTTPYRDSQYDPPLRSRSPHQGAGTGASGLEQDRVENNLRGGRDYLGVDTHVGHGMGANRTAGGNVPVDSMGVNRTAGGNVGQDYDNTDTTGQSHHRGRHVAEGAAVVGTAGVGEHEWREHERRKDQGQTNTGGGWNDTQGQGQGQNYDQGVTGGQHDHRGRHVAEGAAAVGTAGVGEHEWREHERRKDQGQTNTGGGNIEGQGQGQNYDQGVTGGHHEHRGRHIAEGAGAAAVGDHEWKKHERREGQQGTGTGTGTTQGYDQGNTTGQHDHRGRHIAEGAGAAAVGDHEWREHERHQAQQAQQPTNTTAGQQPGFVPGQNVNTAQPGPGIGANQFDTYPGLAGGLGGGGVNPGYGGNTGTGGGGLEGGHHDVGILTGKLEQAAGVLLGNEGMKARGLMKEEEGKRTRDAVNTQQPGRATQGGSASGY